MKHRTNEVESPTHCSDGTVIRQHNGEITDAEGGHIMDAPTLRHLEHWALTVYARNEEEYNYAIETILGYLVKLDREDRNFHLGTDWRSVLTNAEYQAVTEMDS